MRDLNSEKFINAIKSEDLMEIMKIPKADLHNHFVLGGSRQYIKDATGIEILHCDGVLYSMEDMHKWNNKYIGERFNSYEMRKLLIEATFYQAKVDGVTILEIGEDV